jgi:CheY-like chemotaxis protein
VDGSDSRKHEGTGLGLAIADKYSRLLGARIEVTSEPGKGSMFTLVLPLVHKDQPVSNHEGSSRSSSKPNILSDETGSTQGNSEKKILIIEDSEPAIIQLTEILKEQGYHFEIARDGIEALNLVNASIPDAIILDLMMPGMDGFEVLETIRGTQATAQIPVLILTAKFVSKSELNRLTANNIHQLVQKGDVGKEELLSSIRSMIGKTKPQVKGLFTKAVPVVKEGKITILLVEDNEDNVKTIQVLMGDQYNLIVARDGVEGIEKAKSMNPDLILLDISLPLKDGFVVLEEIRKSETLQKVPVIAVTARAMKGDREHFLNHGFDDYISKPIDSDFFEATLSKWILEVPGN